MQRWQLVQQQNWVILQSTFLRHNHEPNQTKPNQMIGRKLLAFCKYCQIWKSFLFHCARMHSMRIQNDEKARNTRYFECFAFSQWEMEIEIQTHKVMHSAHKVSHLDLSEAQANEMVTFQAFRLWVSSPFLQKRDQHSIATFCFPNIQTWKPQESAKKRGSWEK